MGAALSIVALLVLALAAVLEWRAHRKVRAVKAHLVSPEAVRYLMTRGEDR
jgi:hypothetical protein